MISVENHNICKLCDNAKFDKPCPTCTDLAWEGFSIKEHDKQIRADAIDEFADLMLEKLPRNMDKTFTCGEIALLICGVAEQLNGGGQKNEEN